MTKTELDAMVSGAYVFQNNLFNFAHWLAAQDTGNHDTDLSSFLLWLAVGLGDNMQRKDFNIYDAYDNFTRIKQ